MTQRVLRPEDVSFNCSFLVQRYFEDGKYDSVRIILDYWEQKCGLDEPVIRMKILYSIFRDTFSEDLYEQGIISYLLTYKRHNSEEVKGAQSPYFYGFWVYRRAYYPTHPAFDEFTQKLAYTNLKKVHEGDVRYLLCKFYSNEFDFVINELKSDRYDHTYLKRYYDNEVEETLSQMEGHLGFIGGAWFPQGKAKTLGIHPTLGLSLGFKKNRILYDLTMILRFLDSSNRYNIEHKGSIIETKDFLSYYFGLELGHEIYRDRRNEIDFLIGTGYDAFTAYRNKDDTNDKKEIDSFNFNVGVGYRYYFSDFTTKYIGFQVRTNLVSYHNPGGTDLSGSTISFRIIFSGSKNSYKYWRLKRLEYDL